jgi:hypothetical protein
VAFRWLGAETRVVEEEYEAVLSDASGREQGKVEWKRYRGGERSLKVRVRGLEVPDGAEVEARIGGRSVARLAVSGGRARAKWRSGEGAEVPDAAHGEDVEVRGPAGPLLRGALRPD